MRIAIVGGTGKQGTGLALRWARAGHTVSIGSRNADRARARVEELTREGTQVGANPLEGGSNTWAAAQADVVALTVPYDAHVDTLRAIEPHVAGKIVIDMTVPLKPPKVSRVNLPPGQAAALESQALLPAASVVAALHHVSSTHLADLAHTLDCDVLVAGDDARAKATVIELVRDLPARGLDAGALVNAIALESLTPVLIHLNKTYKSEGAGIVFTDLPGAPPRR